MSWWNARKVILKLTTLITFCQIQSKSVSSQNIMVFSGWMLYGWIFSVKKMWSASIAVLSHGSPNFIRICIDLNKATCILITKDFHFKRSLRCLNQTARVNNFLLKFLKQLSALMLVYCKSIIEFPSCTT